MVRKMPYTDLTDRRTPRCELLEGEKGSIEQRAWSLRLLLIKNLLARDWAVRFSF